MSTATTKRFRIGIVGLGAAGRAFLPAITKHPGFDLVAIAEPVTETRESIAAETHAAGYADLPALLNGTDVDAIYIATPTELHPEHAAIAFDAKKHVLTEKPMAVRLDEAEAMTKAAKHAGITLLVGHAHGFDLPIQRMREIILSGELGRVRMIHTWNYTDWIYRPRRPDELELDKGGGVTFRQGSHQFDIIRMLGGGMVKSVRATTFDWDPQRSATGAHTVFLHFADGTTATAVYNGYGYFSAMELCGDVTEWGFVEPIEQRPPVTRPSAGRSAADELEAKRKRAKGAIPASAPFQPTFGLTIASCERGDIRQSPRGLYVYSAEGRREIVLPTDQSPRDLVLAEFHDALTGKAPPLHDGRWGLANLEVSVAALESSATGREIELKHQVAAAR
ncbi:MAG TPA: Gfo/Idh/MocA family oxidoreductase [Xanthobacteraceae bacterium]|jgi:phthalate 4,5-cis-dihydrodiol dehydrogenase|nr:Gfo/Idh/MocA family oxidoreductase [Xanthobacteraceae bacterium]